MYVCDLGIKWLDHPFGFNKKLIENKVILKKIQSMNIKTVTVDFEKSKLISFVKIPKSREFLTSYEKSIPIKDSFINRSIKIMKELSEESKNTDAVNTEKLNELVNDIVDSIFENDDILLALVKLREFGNNSFTHSICVGVLMTKFCVCQKIPHDQILDAGKGAFLHDIGVTSLDIGVTSLDKDDLSHIDRTREVLLNSKNISMITLLTAIRHCERYNGTGYPEGLKGNDIDLFGRMIAIVHDYDVEILHGVKEPTSILRDLLNLVNIYYDEKLTYDFIKCLGFFPIGSLVRLSNKKLAVVVGSTSDLYKPIVNVIFDIKQNGFVKCEIENLTEGKNKILSHQLPKKWGINPAIFIEVD